MLGIRLTSAARNNCLNCQGHLLNHTTHHNITAYEKYFKQTELLKMVAYYVD